MGFFFQAWGRASVVPLGLGGLMGLVFGALTATATKSDGPLGLDATSIWMISCGENGGTK